MSGGEEDQDESSKAADNSEKPTADTLPDTLSIPEEEEQEIQAQKEPQEHQHDSDEPYYQRRESDGKLIIKSPALILLDLYGCVAAHSFKKELKPYFENNVEDYINRNWNDGKVQRMVNNFREQSEVEASSSKDVPQIEAEGSDQEAVKRSTIAYIRWLFKHKPQGAARESFKILQENVWEDGYKTGKFKTHVYDDVPDAFNAWRRGRFYIKLFGYASGSKDGQKMYYKATVKGDLTKYFNNWLDTSGDIKKKKDEYVRTANRLREKPKNIVFLADEPDEARPAQEAGMKAVVVLRPGNKKYTEEELRGIPTIRSFDEIEFVEGGVTGCC